jgi:hypothetical protein
MPSHYGGDSKMYGTKKSSARNAPMDKDGGNYGVPVGDTGSKSKKGNSRTKQVSDRYK